MQQRANVVHWAGIGTLVGAVCYALSPMPDSSMLASGATGLIGGALLGGLAAGIRNWLGPK